MAVWVVRWLFVQLLQVRCQVLGVCARDSPAAHAATPDFTPARPRRRGGRPKPPAVREWVLRRHREAGGSARALAIEFTRAHAGQAMSVSHNTVRQWLASCCARSDQVREATRNRVPPHIPANRRWGLDCTGKADVTGRVHCILGAIDHGTRFVPLLVRLGTQDAQAILAHLRATIERYGRPQYFRTDNASVFRSEVFRVGLASLGILHEFTKLGSPWENGRIERFFLTLKQQLNRVVPRDGEALDKMLAEFATWYNEIRPHQHLHGFTPWEVWRGIDPYQTVPEAIQRFEAWGGMLKGMRLLR